MAKKNIGKKSVISNSKSEKKEKKELKKQEKVQNKSSIIGILVIFILIAAIAAVALNWDKIKGSNNEQIAASVNGEIITVSQLDSIYNRLPMQTQLQVTKSALLDQMITETVLVQKANSVGLDITDDEVNEFLNGLIIQSGLSNEEFEQRLQAQNISTDLVKEEIYKQLLITKLYQQEVIDKIEVSDDEIGQYYNDNIDLFMTEEQINAKHILICHTESTTCESNLTKEEALLKANEIKAMINDTNFEELAAEYSMGPSAPNGGDLGYFGRGVMVEQFETAAFNLDLGEVSQPVETSFGYHIIKTVDKVDAGVQDLDDVKSQINDVLVQQKQQDVFMNYLDQIKTDANIINFYESSVVATTK